MRRLTSLVIFCCVATASAAHAADTIYRWRDAAGGVHFSNRDEVVPSGASEVTLPPIAVRSSAITVTATSGPRSRPATPIVAPPPRARVLRRTSGCGEADATGIADAVATRLGQRQLDGLTLIVGGIPVAHSADAEIVVKGPDVGAQVPRGPTEQAAIAYPEGTRCPTRPPLERYAIAGSRRAPSRRLCDDYRRAFAEVGVAVSRDQEVARSFHDIADEFVRVAARGHAAGGRGVVVTVPGDVQRVAYAAEDRVPLPPWLVDAHVAQTSELGGESARLVDQLSVALEEIDAAARRAGCW